MITLILLTLGQWQTCPPGSQCGPGGCTTLQPWQIQQPQRSRRIIQPPREPSQDLDIPVVKIKNGQWVGSGVIISDNGDIAEVLSCGHLFREGVQGITVYISNRSFTGGMIKYDVKRELSLVKIASPGVGIHPLASRNPRPGETVKAFGFSGGNFRGIEGRVAGYDPLNPWIKLAFSLPDGCSGGPVFNLKWQLVGIYWGSLNNEGFVVPVEMIREFLGSRVAPRNPPVDIVDLPDVPPTSKKPPILPSPNNDGHPVECEHGRDIKQLKLDIKRLVPIEGDVARLKVSVGSLETRVEKLEVEWEGFDFSKLQGGKGDRGKRGIQGKQGLPGEADTDAIVKTVMATIEERLHTHESEDPVSQVSHLVLVTNHYAEYWGELRELLEEARDHYARIELVSPKADVGPLPVLVAYQDGSPVWKAVGLEKVKTALLQVANDSFSPLGV